MNIDFWARDFGYLFLEVERGREGSNVLWME